MNYQTQMRDVPREIFLTAARVPKSLAAPQAFGLWRIDRLHEDIAGPLLRPYSILRRVEPAWCPELPPVLGAVVMDDSRTELSRHLPIWLAARGRVLVTGLGLGCVVRGLLASPAVERIDVVEIDADIIRTVGAEFAGERRVEIYHTDALHFRPAGQRWDYAWHDLHSFDAGVHLQLMHAQLIANFLDVCGYQGAWGFPRVASRRLPFRLIGAPRARR